MSPHLSVFSSRFAVEFRVLLVRYTNFGEVNQDLAIAKDTVVLCGELVGFSSSLSRLVSAA